MGVPTQKRSKSSKHKRASHFGLKKVQANICEHCKAPVLSHHACANCGFYNGKEVIKIKVKSKKTVSK